MMMSDFLKKGINYLENTTLITSSLIYSLSTFIEIILTRTIANLLTLLVNNVSIGTAIDNTHTTSNLMVEDLDLGDRINNILINTQI